MLFNVNNEVSAQEEFGGTVKYQKTTKFNFDSRDDQRWKDFIATLPKKGNYSYVLYFKNDVALYKHNPEEQEASTPGLQRAMHVQNMMNPPKPELKKEGKVYFFSRYSTLLTTDTCIFLESFCASILLFSCVRI